MAPHPVEGGGGVLAARLHQVHTGRGGGALGGAGPGGPLEHRRGRVDDHDVAAGAGQRDALGAGPGAHVDDPPRRRGQAVAEVAVDDVAPHPAPRRAMVLVDEHGAEPVPGVVVRVVTPHGDADQVAKSGSLGRVVALRPLGSSQSSWRPRAVRSR